MKFSINKEARKRIGAPCMHKEPWPVWYHHNHPDKTVGNAKAITVTKYFAGHTSLAPHTSTSENAKHLDSSQGPTISSPLFTLIAKQSRSSRARQSTSIDRRPFEYLPQLLNKGGVYFVQSFWRCGYYSRAATNRVRRLMAEI